MCSSWRTSQRKQKSLTKMSEILVMGAVKCLSCIFLSDHTKLQSAETGIRAQSGNETRERQETPFTWLHTVTLVWEDSSLHWQSMNLRAVLLYNNYQLSVLIFLLSFLQSNSVLIKSKQSFLSLLLPDLLFSFPCITQCCFMNTRLTR